MASSNAVFFFVGINKMKFLQDNIYDKDGQPFKLIGTIFVKSLFCRSKHFNPAINNEK